MKLKEAIEFADWGEANGFTEEQKNERGKQAEENPPKKFEQERQGKKSVQEPVWEPESGSWQEGEH